MEVVISSARGLLKDANLIRSVCIHALSIFVASSIVGQTLVYIQTGETGTGESVPAATAIRSLREVNKKYQLQALEYDDDRVRNVFAHI